MGLVTLWGFLSHISVSRGNNSPSGWASLFHSGCWGSWRHGLTGQRVFRQLQVDKMIPTLNDNIIITENITTKYQLVASHLQVSACWLNKQNMAFHSCITFVILGINWINSLYIWSLPSLFLKRWHHWDCWVSLELNPQFHSFKGKLPSLWSIKYNLGPDILYWFCWSPATWRVSQMADGAVWGRPEELIGI